MTDNKKPWKMDRHTIAVDFDGTLCTYTTWKGPGGLGDPIVPMVERVKRWLSEGKKVKIFTARISLDTKEELKEAIDAIEAWCLEHLGQVLPITNVKTMDIEIFWDDKAIPVIENTGEIGYEDRLHFL